MKIDREHRVSDLTDRHVAHVDMLDHPAACGVVLEPQRRVEIRAVHLASLGVDVPHASGVLAAERHAAMPVLHAAVPYDVVLTWLCKAASIGFATGFHRDAV